MWRRKRFGVKLGPRPKTFTQRRNRRGSGCSTPTHVIPIHSLELQSYRATIDDTRMILVLVAIVAWSKTSSQNSQCQNFPFFVSPDCTECFLKKRTRLTKIQSLLTYELEKWRHSILIVWLVKDLPELGLEDFTLLTLNFLLFWWCRTGRELDADDWRLCRIQLMTLVKIENEIQSYPLTSQNLMQKTFGDCAALGIENFDAEIRKTLMQRLILRRKLRLCWAWWRLQSRFLNWIHRVE